MSKNFCRRQKIITPFADGKSNLTFAFRCRLASRVKPSARENTAFTPGSRRGALADLNMTPPIDVVGHLKQLHDQAAPRPDGPEL